jgi:MFS family permease
MSFTSAASTKMPRTLYAIAVGRAVSFLGDEVALLAMAFRAKAELGHFGVAAILIAGMVPLLAFAPISGLLVDRVRTLPLLVAVSTLQAVVCVALAYSSAALLIPLVFLLACGTAVASPAWQALVPSIVTDEQLPSAMGLLQSSTATAGVAGPFLGGLLVGTFAFHVPLLADAVSFAILALIPVVFGIDRRPVARASRGVRTEAFAGFSLIARSEVLRSLVVLVTFFILTLGMINVVEIWFVTGALHAGPLGYGLLGACLAGGMLVAGVASGSVAKRFSRPDVVFVAGCAGLCVGILAFGLTHALWEAAVAIAFTGVCNGALNVNAMVLLTRNSGEAIRGRVFAAVQGTVGAAQIAAMACGGLLLSSFPSDARTIILAGAAASVVALCATVRPVLRAGRNGASDAAGLELEAISA